LVIRTAIASFPVNFCIFRNWTIHLNSKLRLLDVVMKNIVGCLRYTLPECDFFPTLFMYSRPYGYECIFLMFFMWLT
jgi:hypothetical protein